jgi:hypothetical protein
VACALGALLLACQQPGSAPDIPADKLRDSFADVTTMKAYVKAGIRGFKENGTFDAQVVWRAPRDLRVRCSYFEFASGKGRFQLWLPDENKFLRGTLDDFRKSERGALFYLFDAALPRRPEFFAYAWRDGWFWGIADDAFVRFNGTTPIERVNGATVRYAEFHQGVPISLEAQAGGKAISLYYEKEKLKLNVPVQDAHFELEPPDGAIIEDFKP